MSTAHAFDTLPLANDEDSYGLGLHLWYLEDRGGDWTLADVQSPTLAGQWRKSRSNTPTFGYTRSAYWFALKLHNPSDSLAQYLLNVAYPVLDKIDLYLVRQDKSVARFQAGDRLAFDRRPIEHRDFLFPLQFAPRKQLTLYLRIQTSSALQVPLTLWREQAFWAADQTTLLIQGLYFGVMLVMILYNLFIYLSVRDRSYVFYVLFVTSFGLFQLTLQGIAYHHLWPHNPWLNEKMLGVTVSAAIGFASFFGIELLKLRRESKTLFAILLLTAVAASTNALCALAVPYLAAVLVALLLSLLGTSSGLAAGVRMWQRGYPPARYFTIAWVSFILGTLVFALNKYGIAPRNLFTENALQAGSALEVMLLSFALANRINVVRREKDIAQADAVRALKKYRALFENAVEGIFQINTDYRYTGVNDAMANILGFESSEELLAAESTDVKHYFANPDDANQICHLVHRQGEVVDFESQCRRPDGSSFWASWTARAVRDEEGKFTGIEGSLIDITVRKEKEQVEREGERAKATAQARSQFFAAMSHEIRTPMNGVLGMTELLLNSDLNSTQRRFAETVRQSGGALLGIINDILDFSKIDAGKLELESIDFNLRDLVEDVGTLFAEPAQRKGLELICDLASETSTVFKGDPGRLRQVLTNLLSNAIKFTEVGEVVLRVAPMAREHPHTIVRFEVSDTGAGIGQDAQPQIFHAFTQADSSTTRKFGGTGLGLAICRQLVELMDGEIGLESELARGAKFWFTIPLETGAVAPPPPTAVAKDLEGLRVLIVDDNATNRAVLHHQMDAWAIVCQSAASGEEALRVLEDAAAAGRGFDLGVLDMRMPGMDGLQLASTIEKHPLLSRLPLVMLSSLSQAENAQARTNTGIRCQLTKPVRQSELYNCLARVVAYTRQHPTPQVAHPRASPTEGRSSFAGSRVLLVEDNRVNQEVARAMLEFYDCHVDIANNGLEAVQASLRDSFDLIFMDCEMPEMDGFAATAELHRHESRRLDGKTTPIVALTANALDTDRDRCLAAGMDDYLSKPLSQAQLRTVLERWLNPKLSEATGHSAAMDQ